MNNGLFGFFIGANVTINIQEFEISGVWVKPPNAQLCFIEGTGGGQGGAGNTTVAGTRAGGSAGCAYQIILNASELQGTEYVAIAVGGTGTQTAQGNEGGDTTFAGLYWAGGLNGGATNTAGRVPHSGALPSHNWGQGGSTSGSGNGRHGGWGAGGGGRSGNTGGKPRSFEFASAANTPALGGGAPAGNDARPEFDVDGFGEGAGGTSNNGRRGSGGGAAPFGTNNTGGNGGDGFLRVITYCWE